MASKTLVLAAALLFAAEAPAAASSDEPAPDVRVEGSTIFYRGPVTPQSNAEVRALLESGHPVRLLDITSPGGEVGAGMDLGELIHAHALDVRITDYCISSCANYVFPAARRKFLPADSIVVWHGSVIQQGLNDIANIDFSAVEASRGRPLSDEEKAAIIDAGGFRQLKDRQARFYRMIGVDERVTVIGQLVGCNCEWTLPVPDMESFGIRDIIAPDGYGEHLEVKGRLFTLLRLSDHAGQQFTATQ